MPLPDSTTIAGAHTVKDWKALKGQIDAHPTPLTNALAMLAKSQYLNFGIAADSGYFEVKYVKGAKPAVNTFKKTRALAAFIMRLLSHLQTLGTVTAMDYKEYSRILDD